jgi:hypothetical protein
VASNGVLRSIARHRPTDLDALTAVPDVRAWQVRDYGAAILEVLAAADPAQPDDETPAKGGRKRRRRRRKPASGSAAGAPAGDAAGLACVALQCCGERMAVCHGTRLCMGNLQSASRVSNIIASRASGVMPMHI